MEIPIHLFICQEVENKHPDTHFYSENMHTGNQAYKYFIKTIELLTGYGT